MQGEGGGGEEVILLGWGHRTPTMFRVDHPEHGGRPGWEGGHTDWGQVESIAVPLPLPQVEVVFWLLSMLATRDQEDTARTLLAMSSSPESCVAMRRSGCLPLLLQILHGTEAGAGGRNGTAGVPGAKDARMRANAALHNIVFSQPDQGLARKEMRVLHVLEQIRAYCETCWDWLQAQDSTTKGGGVGSGKCAASLATFVQWAQSLGFRGSRVISLAATGLFCELSLCHVWAEAYGDFIIIDWQKEPPATCALVAG